MQIKMTMLRFGIIAYIFSMTELLNQFHFNNKMKNFILSKRLYTVSLYADMTEHR